MTTSDAILVTQIPIALGIFWLAWELRALRKRIVDVVDAEED